MATELALLSVLDRGERLPPLDRALLLARAAGATEPEALPLGERDRAILTLRARLLGDQLEGADHCPSCGALAVFTLSTADVASLASRGGSIAVDADGYTLVCRPPTTEDLQRALAADEMERRAALLAAVVLAARFGDSPVAAAALPERVVAVAGEALSQCDPLADVELRMVCEDCGAGWVAGLDLAEFVWRELCQWSRRVLWEVHTLARAYGWTEAEVLAVPSSRRQIYLEWATNG